jgi:hypothetical protein
MSVMQMIVKMIWSHFLIRFNPYGPGVFSATAEFFNIPLRMF